MNFRMKAAVWHSLASAGVALGASWLVFSLWYPSPLSQLAGGASLFLLLIAVDVTLGPLLTLVVANPTKRSAELARDLAVIVTVQVAALAYGMYTVAQARPVALSFEIDLFRLVSANEVEREQLGEAPERLRNLSWSGPVTLAAVKPSSAEEQFDTIHLGLAGIPLSALPRYWREYSTEQARAWGRSQALADTLVTHPKLRDRFNALAQTAGLAPDQLRTLPLLGRKSEGFVLLAPPDGRVVGAVSQDERP